MLCLLLENFAAKPDAIGMQPHIAIWKDVIIEKGTPADGPDMLPTLIYLDTKAKLLSQIVRMPKAHPISFEDAVRFVEKKWCAAFDAKNFGSEPGGMTWYTTNFVEYISSLGFHIELSGDEFEVKYRNKIPI